MELYILDFFFYFCQSIKDSSRQSASCSAYSVDEGKLELLRRLPLHNSFLFYNIHFITYNANDLNSSDLKSDEGR